MEQILILHPLQWSTIFNVCLLFAILKNISEYFETILGEIFTIELGKTH